MATFSFGFSTHKSRKPRTNKYVVVRELCQGIIIYDKTEEGRNRYKVKINDEVFPLRGECFNLKGKTVIYSTNINRHGGIYKIMLSKPYEFNEMPGYLPFAPAHIVIGDLTRLENGPIDKYEFKINKIVHLPYDLEVKQQFKEYKDAKLSESK